MIDQATQCGLKNRESDRERERERKRKSERE